ncbi:MAG: leucine-rich repeat domain-containing protein, partial [Treponema sp.]|nr:leucine-rich repeat domain-containing protein [Treponema sp.]
MYKKMLLVTVVVMAAITAAFAQTEADFEVGLTEDGTGAVVKKYVGKAAAVRIPAVIQEMPVKEIGRSAFNGNAALTSVVIPEGVEKIDMFAFYNCRSLASVT